jgi:predicted GH43/DUF377 family glycosyl hydrolase
MFVAKRSPHNPILLPSGRAFEEVACFNPSAVRHDGKTHLFYRAMARPDALLTPYAGLSTVGHAVMGDREAENREQVIIPEQEWEQFGCEDPRATFFEGSWYVFYTALGGFPFGPSNIKVAMAKGDAPDKLHEKHLVTPFNAKAAALFPERVAGDAVLLFTAHTDYTDEYPRPTIALARSRHVEDFWDPAFWKRFHDELPRHALPELRRSDTDHIEVGAAPIETEHGWLLIYSHITDYYDESKRRFGIEAALLDRNDPQKIVGRTEFPFLVPEAPYERYGAVPNIAFPSGAVVCEDRLDIFYGAADTVGAMASVSLKDLLAAMTPESRKSFAKRDARNPLLSPLPEHAWESKAVFNAAATLIDGTTHLLYRAMGDENTSVFGYAKIGEDGGIAERLPTPAYVPRAPLEMKTGDPHGNSGCEDPRLTRLGDTLYLTYTAFDGRESVRGALSSISVEDFVAKRFDRWKEPVLVTPEGVVDKDVCLLPGKVGGEYLLIHRIDPNICAHPLPDLNFSKPLNRCIEIIGPRPGMWDHEKVGAAAPPVQVTLPSGEDAWLFVYHAIGRDRGYRLGAVLLDVSAANVLSRTSAPILEPVDDWEMQGQIGNVVFSCGMTVTGDTLRIYYGGADTKLGAADVSLSRLLSVLAPDV